MQHMQHTQLMQRWSWRILLRLALGAGALQLYCAPLRVLEHSGYRHRNAHAHTREQGQGQGQEPSHQFEDVLFLRMWLVFAVTLYALCGVISKQVVLVSLLHALIHFARSISDAPFVVSPHSSPSLSSRLLSIALYWRTSTLEACAYEYGALLSFALLLRYVLFPPASALVTFQRHSRNLKAFFAQHDREFVPLVDRLLEEYTGHERLLYARIRRLYCAQSSRTASSKSKSSSSTSKRSTATAIASDAAPLYVSTTTTTAAAAPAPAQTAAAAATTTTPAQAPPAQLLTP